LHKVLAAIVLLSLSLGAASEELPPATEFWYCSHLYRWALTQVKEKSPLLERYTTSAKMFEAGAAILSNGVAVKGDYDSAANDFRESLRKAAAENKKPLEFFTEIDTACYDKQRRYAMAMLKKSGEIGKALEPYFTHPLPTGQVDAESIAKRQEQVKSGQGVRVEDGKDTIVYSFTRALGDARDSAHHVFTKEGNPAHPAVIFLRSQKSAGSTQPANSNTGSYAGAKKDFDGLYMAFLLMNQGR
jgi:hypothetical protein